MHQLNGYQQHLINGEKHGDLNEHRQTTRIEWIDCGEGLVSWLTVAEADAFDHVLALEGAFVDVFASIPGWSVEQAVTSSTNVIRPNQNAEVEGLASYADARMRRALVLAVDNQVIRDLGTIRT